MSAVLLPSQPPPAATGRMLTTTTTTTNNNNNEEVAAMNNILLNVEYLEDNITIADDATLSVHGDDKEDSSSSSSSSSGEPYQWDTHRDDNDSSSSSSESDDASSMGINESLYSNVNYVSLAYDIANSNSISNTNNSNNSNNKNMKKKRNKKNDTVSMYSSTDDNNNNNSSSSSNNVDNTKNTNQMKKKKKDKVSMYSSCPIPPTSTEKKNNFSSSSNNISNSMTGHDNGKKRRSKSFYSTTTATTTTSATSNSSIYPTTADVMNLSEEFIVDSPLPSSSEKSEQRQRQQSVETTSEQQHIHNILSELRETSKSPITMPIHEENTDEDEDEDENEDATEKDNSLTKKSEDLDTNALTEEDGISDLSQDDDNSTDRVRDDDTCSMGRRRGRSSPVNVLNKAIRAVSPFSKRRNRKNSKKNNNSPESQNDKNPKTMDAIRRSMSLFSAADKQIASWKSPKTTTGNTIITEEMDAILLACTDDILGDIGDAKKHRTFKRIESSSSSSSSCSDNSSDDESSFSSSQDNDNNQDEAEKFVDRLANAHAAALEKAVAPTKRLRKRNKSRQVPRDSNGSIYSVENNNRGSPTRRRSIKGAIRHPLKMLKKIGGSRRNLHGSQRSLQTDDTDGNNSFSKSERRISQGSVATEVMSNNRPKPIRPDPTRPEQLERKSSGVVRRGSFVESLRRASSAGTTDSDINLEEHHQRMAESEAYGNIFDAVTTAASEIKSPTSDRKTMLRQMSKKKKANNLNKAIDNNEHNSTRKWQSLLIPSKGTFENIRRRGSGILTKTIGNEDNGEQKDACEPTTNERQVTMANNIRESVNYSQAEGEVDLNDTKHRIKEAASRFKNRQKTMKNQLLARELRESREEEEKLEQELMEYEQRVCDLEERHKPIVEAAVASVPLPDMHGIYVLIETTQIQQEAVDDTRSTLKIQARLLRSQLASNNDYLESLIEEEKDEASKSLQLEQLFNKCGLAPAGFDDLMSSQIKLELECEELNQKLAALGYYDTDSDDGYDPHAYAHHDDEDFMAAPTFNRGASLQHSSGHSEDIMQQMMMMQNNNQNHLFPGESSGGGSGVGHSAPRRRSKTIAYLR